ncbi:MAG: ATP-binding protein [Patescibacteria group bacterium]
MLWFKKEQRENLSTEENWSFEKQILNSLIESTADAVIFYNTDFQILIFNRAAEELFNLRADQVIGKQFSLDKMRQGSSKLLSYAMFPSLAPTVVRQSLEGIYPQIVDLNLDDPQIDLRIYLNKVPNQKGETVGFVKIIHDQTREKEILQSQKDFLTIAAHQLRTPGTAVNWAFEALVGDQSLSKEAKDFVNTGHLAAKNLMKIVNDLLNITQIEEGKFGYQFQEIDLITFFDNLLTEAEPIAKEYKVKVYLEKPAQSVKILADVQKLSIAISNIIDNAMKYNVPNGEVVVKIESMPDFSVKISIKDTGVGIPEEEAKNLFNKFFRASNISKTKVEGSGLGLYIVKNVIEKHGGKIWAESVLNRGTTFFIILPTNAGTSRSPNNS